jgi:predicted DNA-binding transcriptional regulator YafY
MSGEPSRESRVLRLEALKALLAERDTTTVADLAEELGVSARTLHRDLALLRDMGVPVEGDRGTGGGLRLEPGWSLGRVHLNKSEALGLLLSLTIAEKVGSPLLLDDLRSITRKVGAAFAPAQARRILALRRRILVGQTASDQVLAGSPPDPQSRRRCSTRSRADAPPGCATRTSTAPSPTARSNSNSSTTTCRSGTR